MDLAASKLKMDPVELRRKNIMSSSDFPVSLRPDLTTIAQVRASLSTWRSR